MNIQSLLETSLIENTKTRILNLFKYSTPTSRKLNNYNTTINYFPSLNLSKIKKSKSQEIDIDQNTKTNKSSYATPILSFITEINDSKQHDTNYQKESEDDKQIFYYNLNDKNDSFIMQESNETDYNNNNNYDHNNFNNITNLSDSLSMIDTNKHLITEENLITGYKCNDSYPNLKIKKLSYNREYKYKYIEEKDSIFNITSNTNYNSIYEYYYNENKLIMDKIKNNDKYGIIDYEMNQTKDYENKEEIKHYSYNDTLDKLKGYNKYEKLKYYEQLLRNYEDNVTTSDYFKNSYNELKFKLEIVNSNYIKSYNKKYKQDNQYNNTYRTDYIKIEEQEEEKYKTKYNQIKKDYMKLKIKLADELKAKVTEFNKNQKINENISQQLRLKDKKLAQIRIRLKALENDNKSSKRDLLQQLEAKDKELEQFRVRCKAFDSSKNELVVAVKAKMAEAQNKQAVNTDLHFQLTAKDKELAQIRNRLKSVLNDKNIEIQDLSYQIQEKEKELTQIRMHIVDTVKAKMTEASNMKVISDNLTIQLKEKDAELSSIFYFLFVYDSNKDNDLNLSKIYSKSNKFLLSSKESLVNIFYNHFNSYFKSKLSTIECDILDYKKYLVSNNNEDLNCNIDNYDEIFEGAYNKYFDYKKINVNESAYSTTDCSTENEKINLVRL